LEAFIRPYIKRYSGCCSIPVLARTRVGRGHRTTVPREVRKILEVDDGDVLEWVFEDGKAVVRRSGGRG